MQKKILQTPLDPAGLKTIVSQALATYGDDLNHTAEWLLRNREPARRVEELRSVWRRSTLPLKEWADLIRSVQVCVTVEETYLWLAVELDRQEWNCVLVQAPMTSEMLHDCGWERYGAIPNIMRDVALHAPGLYFEDAGLIGDPRAYVEPLSELRRWLKGCEVPLELCDTGEVFSVETLVAEVASDRLGNQILLGKDGLLYFWDHELVTAFRRCKVGLADLIRRFFDDPTCIMDDDFLGVMAL